MRDKGDTVYRQYAVVVGAFQFLTGSHAEVLEVQDGVCHVDAADVSTLPKLTSSTIREIVWEEDARGIALTGQHCEEAAAADVSSSAPGETVVVPETLSDSEVIDVEEFPVVTPHSAVSTTESSAFESERGVEDNFADFTYWTVETGPRVSHTSKPLYATNRTRAVTLLEDSEGFVATSMWGEQNATRVLQVPRHLLVQAAQVASRAIFDPDYRTYLQESYDIR
ncbi:uncharacterized protein BcabD6B2_33020 [Babesia caballi]|uniref:Uncharacterized protein n=1 Tax=Babesia caballi TaxID=5871 RepID=A0AAV4LW50_BABCB|nr:hypothetical protein, conserved [Babesia caballi]